MARPLRPEFSGALYHITSRGDRREDIYYNNSDRALFLEILEHTCQRYNWICYAHCLMINHVLCGTPHKTWSSSTSIRRRLFKQPHDMLAFYYHA